MWKLDVYNWLEVEKRCEERSVMVMMMMMMMRMMMMMMMMPGRMQ